MSDTIRPDRTPLVAPGMIEHHAADLTFTCSADVTLDTLQRSLGQAGQWLPMDGDPRATLAELIAVNSTGPLRLGFGGWRDLLLGVQFRAASGTLITAGGRAMKNVAGYDLTKFMVGSFGRFGEMVTITARTYRRPAHALLAGFAPDDQLLGRLIPTPARPQWSMLAGDELYCGYLGDAVAIDFYETELAALRPISLARQTVDDDISFRASRWMPSRPDTRFRASVPPSQTVSVAMSLDTTSSAADPAFGIIVGSCDPGGLKTLRAAVAAAGGMVVFDDPDDLRNLGEADETTRALIHRIQSAFNG